MNPLEYLQNVSKSIVLLSVAILFERVFVENHSFNIITFIYLIILCAPIILYGWATNKRFRDEGISSIYVYLPAVITTLYVLTVLIGKDSENLKSIMLSMTMISVLITTAMGLFTKKRDNLQN